MKDLPVTAAAVAAGEVSLGQAAEVARAEKEVPGSEAELLDLAKRAGLGPVRERARQIILGAADPKKLGHRQHQARCFRHWRDGDGMVRFSGALAPVVGVGLMNRVDAEANRLSRAAQHKDSFAAHSADALVSMLEGKGSGRPTRAEVVVVVDLSTGQSGPGRAEPGPAGGETGGGETGPVETGHSETGRSEPGRSETGHSETGHSETGRSETGRSETGHGGSGRAEPGPGEPRRAGDRETRRGETRPGEASPGEASPGEASSGEASQGERASAGLRGGGTDGGEPGHGGDGRGYPEPAWHIVGGGPVAPGQAWQLIKDAFVKAVVHNGTEVTHVAHFGRHIPAELRTALELGRPPDFDGVKCSVPGCERRYGLEWDHIDPVANKGPTSYQNLQALCGPHHWEKTERDRKAGRHGARAP